MVIKTLSLENPFADYGSIITGHRFVGRIEAIKTIHNRILGESYGNIAIMGLPRIGKTCLAWNAMMPLKDELSQKKHFLSFIGVSTVSNSNDFFKLLISSTLDEIEFSEENGAVFSKLQSIYDKLRAVEKDRFEFTNHVQKFFKFLKRSGVRVTYILDEFDYAEKIFSVSDFQTLRQLSSQPETQICLITVSRRTIQEIEPENGAISNFYGVFSDLRIGMFSDLDISDYWKHTSSIGIEITEAYQKKVEYLAGRHPYLIDLLNYHIFNDLKANSESNFEKVVETTESTIRLTLYNSFDSTLGLLHSENLYAKAFQLVLGPVYDVSSSDEQKLLKYEFLKEVNQVTKETLLKRSLGVQNIQKHSSYICFSEFFTKYWNLKFSETNYWPLWETTEKGLRELVKVHLDEKYGDDWLTEYKLEYASSDGKMKGIGNLEYVRGSTKIEFGNLASNHLIDYTFPRDIYNLFISSDWHWFGQVFGNNLKDWGKKFTLLSTVRNPIAHSNSEFIPQETINLCKIYCSEILEKIKSWHDSRR